MHSDDAFCFEENEEREGGVCEHAQKSHLVGPFPSKMYFILEAGWERVPLISLRKKVAKQIV